jgi:hypothetical protein
MSDKYGAVEDIAGPISTHVPIDRSHSAGSTDTHAAYPGDSHSAASADSHAGQPQKHVLKPEDGNLIKGLAHKQAENMSLSPQQEQKLEHALTLVSNSGQSQDSLNQLAQMAPELAQPNSPVGQAFQNALSELGYKPQLGQSHQDGATVSTMHLEEPRPGFFGGGAVDIQYQSPSASNPSPQIMAHHLTYR